MIPEPATKTPDHSAKILNFATREVDATTSLINAVNELNLLRQEWDARNYVNLITDDHLIGDIAHLAATDLVGVFVTLDALNGVLENGHWANLYAVTK